MKSFFLKYEGWLIGLAVVFMLFGAGWAAGTSRGRAVALKSGISTLHTAQDSLHTALIAVEVTETRLRNVQDHADSSDQRVASLERSARSLRDRVPGLIARVDSTHIDSTQAQAVDALYADIAAAADSLQAALVVRTDEVASLRYALNEAQGSLRALARTARAVDTAATAVVKLVRPSLLVRLAPKAGFGVAFGLDITGKPNAIAGMTLGWPR